MEWSAMSLAEQLGNVGSEFERAVRWKQRGKAELAENAALRTLGQLDLTLTDDRHTGCRRREIARLRDEVCGVLYADNIDDKAIGQLQRYFFVFATAAQRARGL